MIYTNPSNVYSTLLTLCRHNPRVKSPDWEVRECSLACILILIYLCWLVIEESDFSQAIVSMFFLTSYFSAFIFSFNFVSCLESWSWDGVAIQMEEWMNGWMDGWPEERINCFKTWSKVQWIQTWKTRTTWILLRCSSRYLSPLAIWLDLLKIRIQPSWVWGGGAPSIYIYSWVRNLFCRSPRKWATYISLRLAEKTCD